MDGPNADIFEIAGLELTEAERERLNEVTNHRDLLNECESVEEIELGESDVPLYSDRFFSYEIRDVEKFKEELRTAVKKALGGLEKIG